MKPILPFIFFSLLILMNGCSSPESNDAKKEKNEKMQESDSIPKNDSIITEAEPEITYNSDTAFVNWKNKIETVIFEPKLFEDKNTAITWFEENGYTVSDTYSEEESKSGLWIVLESSDAKYHIEFLYDYYDTDGHFQGFRNIISKIEDDDRDEMVSLFTELAQNDSRISSKKYKKSYGEEGLLWQNEKKNPQMQTVVVIKGGNTNWIEIVRCFYPRISPDEIIK